MRVRSSTSTITFTITDGGGYGRLRQGNGRQALADPLRPHRHQRPIRPTKYQEALIHRIVPRPVSAPRSPFVPPSRPHIEPRRTLRARLWSPGSGLFPVGHTLNRVLRPRTSRIRCEFAESQGTRIPLAGPTTRQVQDARKQSLRPRSTPQAAEPVRKTSDVTIVAGAETSAPGPRLPRMRSRQRAGC